MTRDQMVKGYEFAKDQYVTFTEEELKAMAEAVQPGHRDHRVRARSTKVDPIYFDSAYYLGPDKGGDRAYTLLAAAMRETSRCALAKWAARGKGYLVLVRAGARRAWSCRRCTTPTRCARSTRCRSATRR